MCAALHFPVCSADIKQHMSATHSVNLCDTKMLLSQNLSWYEKYSWDIHKERKQSSLDSVSEVSL